MAVEAEDGADTVLWVDLDVPWLRQGQVQDLQTMPLTHWYLPQGADPPPPLRVAEAGKNQLNEGIIPLFPTGIGERYSQTISNLGHVALFR